MITGANSGIGKATAAGLAEMGAIVVMVCRDRARGEAAFREGLGAPLPPVDRAAYESAVAACRAQLGESAFAEAWTRAAARPFQEVVGEVLRARRNESIPIDIQRPEGAVLSTEETCHIPNAPSS
jgi:NAD(P)-dependent dehydrogenase (short-subunit alcohol dehydrogenase family)